LSCDAERKSKIDNNEKKIFSGMCAFFFALFAGTGDDTCGNQ
jgi:hypothetical protein